jgi:hypothetical protein
MIFSALQSSGVQESKDEQVPGAAQFIRYAAKISLSVTVSESRLGNINVPLLRVLYKDVVTADHDTTVIITKKCTSFWC